MTNRPPEVLPGGADRPVVWVVVDEREPYVQGVVAAPEAALELLHRLHTGTHVTHERRLEQDPHGDDEPGAPPSYRATLQRAHKRTGARHTATYLLQPFPLLAAEQLGS